MHKSLLLAASIAFFAAPAFAETITANVNGLVCSFCASGIEKTLQQQPAVSKVDVSLENKTVVISTKPDRTLTDADVTRLITDAGYSVTSIQRSN